MSNYRVYVKTRKAKLCSHSKNEDRYLFSEYRFMDDHPVQVMILADGMGGLTEGDRAAQNAVLGCSKALYAQMVGLYMEEAGSGDFSLDYYADRLLKMVKASIKQANTQVCQSVSAYVASGTTLSVVFIVGNYAVAANIGDSPIYLYRAKAKTLQLVSQVQTKAEMEAEAGKYERFSASYYENDHILLHSLGEYSDLEETDICCRVIGRLNEGDMLLTGSDGAFGRMQEVEILEMLSGCGEEEEGFVLTRLLDAARMDKDDDQTAMLYVAGGGEAYA